MFSILHEGIFQFDYFSFIMSDSNIFTLQVSEELIRVSILRHERWHEALEEACKLYFGERNEQAMLRTLLPLHTMMDREPETLNEVAFNQVRISKALLTRLKRRK